MSDFMKYGLVALISIVITIIVLKAIKKKVESKPSQTIDNFKKLSKTSEFKNLLQTPQFKTLVKTSEFKKLALDYGAESIVNMLEI